MSYLWSLIKPLSMFGVMYLVFVKFLHQNINPVSLFLGIVLWSYFSEFTNSGLKSIVDRGDLIRKIYFPRAIIVIASSLSAFITLLLNLLAVGVFMILMREVPTIDAPFFLLLLVELYILSLGAALILSALYVRFRDIAHIWEVVLQALFYSSGVLYVLNAVPAAYRFWLSLNPIVQIIQDARNILISSSPVISTTDVLGLPVGFIPYVLPVLVLGIGVWIFTASSKSFAENV